MQCDIVVVGAGIVGLATADAILRKRPGARVVVVDKESRIAAHQSGRNSGVIHSGLYYAPGSNKARLVRTGRAELLAFCAEYGVEHHLCGKVIVAADQAEHERLRGLADRAEANGVHATLIGPAALRDLEPNVVGVAALHVPDAGIVDFLGVAEQLVRRITAAGGVVSLAWPVSDITESSTGVRLVADSGAPAVSTADVVEASTATPPATDSAAPAASTADVVEASTATLPATNSAAPAASAADVVEASVLVNCAGLFSDRIARLAGADPPERIMPFRGEYYDVVPHRTNLVNNPVYPVPDPAFPFLGAHFTTTIGDGLHVGPNAVPALAREGYRWGAIDWNDLAEIIAAPSSRRLAARYWKTGLGEIWRSLNRRALVAALRRMVPRTELDDLEPAPAGVRAQAIGSDGALLDDFVFRDSARAVHVVNAPSPAATASLAIGATIAERALARL